MKTKNRVNPAPKTTPAPAGKTTATPEAADMTGDVEAAVESPGNLIARAFADPGRLNSQSVLQLQNVMGNQAVQRLLTKQPRAVASAQPIQRVVSVGAKKHAVALTKGEVTNDGIKGTSWDNLEAGHPKGAEKLNPLRAEIKALLITWIDASTSYTLWGESQNKEFVTVQDVYSALVGEVTSKANLAAEGVLAQKVYDSKTIQPHISTFVGKLKNFNDDNKNRVELGKAGRYAFYYHKLPFWFDSVTKSVTDLDGNAALTTTIPVISDYILAAKNIKSLKLPGLGAPDGEKWEELEGARKTHWNVDEQSDWVKEARENDAALSAGPSATTAQVLRFAESLGASKDEMTALAWGLFAWWNKSFKLNQSGTHRFHEVMSVAQIYGVDYAGWVLPDNAPNLAKKD